jgi:hypothetical protein
MLLFIASPFLRKQGFYAFELLDFGRGYDTVAGDYDIAGEAALCGFIKGVIAGNHDNEYVYIDGVARIAGKPVQEMAAFFYMLEKVAKDSSITVTVSVSAAKEELPDFVSKYLDA